jgi:hypothetical protein
VGDDGDDLGPRMVDAPQAVELRLRLEVLPAPLDQPGQQPGDRRPSSNGPRSAQRGPHAGGHRALPGERFAGGRPDRS